MKNTLKKISSVDTVINRHYGAELILYTENYKYKPIIIVLEKITDESVSHFRYGFKISTDETDLFNIHEQSFPFSYSEIIKLPALIQVELIKDSTYKFILQICTELGYYLDKYIKLDLSLMEFALEVYRFKTLCDESFEDSYLCKPTVQQILNVLSGYQYIKIFKDENFDSHNSVIIEGIIMEICTSIDGLILDADVENIDIIKNEVYITIKDYHNLIDIK